EASAPILRSSREGAPCRAPVTRGAGGRGMRLSRRITRVLSLALSAAVAGAPAHAVPAGRCAGGGALVAPAARGGAARRAVLALEVAHDLPQVLLCEEALLLHLLEDLPPALATLLHVHDLVGRQPRRAGLRLEQGRGDLLLDGRALGERLCSAGLGLCADRHPDEGVGLAYHASTHSLSL